MTITALGSAHLQATQAPRVAAEPTLAELTKKHPEAAQAAQQFEAVFLRQLLSTVEKSSTLNGGSETQSAVVGSMLTGALSDHMSSAGGLGLTEVILRAMVTHLPDNVADAGKDAPSGEAAGLAPAFEPHS
jgi:Rod binding domain-containing protein